ncbi:DUF1800 domain-containing protein [Rhodopseudomonas sp. HC1]|uniref:DUF1800 domain-containing protein n=1 Tax=Rhodopseudomonas infernalis TaxID=2897386 RepID=UPI001EE78D05|nr:DUF1800 domain-containing protein [Rhodopseudomonas infernalis]MCG6203738.1 DUF1800 domain-containing protein [Rhodopseudomonas infernalis]
MFKTRNAKKFAAVAAIVAVMATFGNTGSRAAELSAHDLALIDRLSWGVNASTAERVRGVGVAVWLQQQLHPPAEAALPGPVSVQIDAMPDARGVTPATLLALQEQAKEANQIADEDQRKAAKQAQQQMMTDRAKQAAARSILRSLYTPDQLRERMSWFWLNHFNVHQGKADLRLLVGDYEDRAIRPHALGKFGALLRATLRHPAMLRYLDNSGNAAGRVNENYAREIMELHTMGVGSGYTQADVEALAKIFTGVGIDLKPDDPKLKPELRPLLVRHSAFEFNPARHDMSDKTFLGHLIQGRGYAEVEEALDLIVHHPATAQFISRKIAVYFVSDNPPPALIARMAKAFTASDGDIAAVLSAMIQSPEFEAALKSSERFKDPVSYVYSAVRLAYDDKVIANTAPIQNWLNRLGEGLYNRQTPDGYALTSESWSGPGQMMLRFEIARQIGSGSAGLFKPEGPDAKDRPAFPLVQNALYFGGLRQTLSATTRTALDKAISPQDWNTLFLSSPEFMYRLRAEAPHEPS